jgi:hypothetical protein
MLVMRNLVAATRAYMQPSSSTKTVFMTCPLASLLCGVGFHTLLTGGVRFVFCVLLIICSIPLAASQSSTAPVAPEDDTQNWNDVQLTVPLNKRFDFLINAQLRTGNKLRDFAEARAGVGATFKPSKHLSLLSGYARVFSRQPITARRTLEHRFSFAATVHFPRLEKLIITDRNLVERRLFNSRPDTVRYRNRLQVERPFCIAGVPLQLFVSDEVFYDSAAKAWTRNRFTAGGGHSFNKHLTGELYYMRQSDGRSRPGDLHVIGTFLKLRL